MRDAQAEDLSVDYYWIKKFSLKTCSGKIKYPELWKCILLICCLPFSNVPAEPLFSLLKLIKTDLRNRIENITLVSLIQVNYWLKNKDKTSSTVSIQKAVAGFKKKTNACAGDDT